MVEVSRHLYDIVYLYMHLPEPASLGYVLIGTVSAKSPSPRLLPPTRPSSKRCKSPQIAYKLLCLMSPMAILEVQSPGLRRHSQCSSNPSPMDNHGQACWNPRNIWNPLISPT